MATNRLATAVSCQQIREAEKAAFASGVDQAWLMNFAAAGATEVIRQFFPRPGRATLYIGKGNNGGDGLVIARLLRVNGWEVLLELTESPSKLSGLVNEQLAAFEATDAPNNVEPGGPHILVDALLGSGASGPLRESIAGPVQRLNAQRTQHAAKVIAIDGPTGVDADTGEVQAGAVQADITVALSQVKPGWLADSATNHVGRLALVPLPSLDPFLPRSKTPVSTLFTPDAWPGLLPPRAFDSHKGKMGRVAIWAGSSGLPGAARMASAAAVRAGGGLVTLFSANDALPMLKSACTPEVMLQDADQGVDTSPFDVVAVGSGLGRNCDADVLNLIGDCPKPLVIDADGLNALSTQIEILSNAAGPRILTPHPGEMARLEPRGDRSRMEWASAFSERFPGITLLLKGARTIVAASGQPISFNTTGTPGMASGGMGDVLTGVITALLGQGLPPYDAARLGAWICGRAAELAVYGDEQSEQSLCATDVIDHLGRAFLDWQRRAY